MKFFKHTIHKLLIKVMLVVILMTTGWLVNANNNHSYPSVFADQKIVKCYPNPATSFVNFDFASSVNSKNYLLQVYSFSGKKLYETFVSNQRNTLLLGNDFYRGIYIYQLRDKAGRIIETGKFQVVK